MEEEEEEVSWSWPDWLPNGRFPESTVTKLMTYFAAEGFEVFSEEELEFFSKEFSVFIRQLELQTSVYAQKKSFDKSQKKYRGKQIKEILLAMKELSQELSLKLKNAHIDTLCNIRIDSDVLERKIYGKSINHRQMNKFDSLERCLERCLPHIIYAIEQGKYSQGDMKYKANVPANPEDHEFVSGVTVILRAYLKRKPIKAQIHKTIGIILMKKDALKSAINKPRDSSGIIINNPGRK